MDNSEQEWQTRISSIEERQRIIGERLEKIQKGMKEENEERARIQRVRNSMKYNIRKMMDIAGTRVDTEENS